MARALIFPGQGSQAVGMGRDLACAFASARHLFEEVDEALKQNLSAIMFAGPKDELTLTENAQPALMAVSLAVIRVLQVEGGMDIAKTARFVAGHSLGEYSALAAAATFSVSETAKLLKIRGRAMQEAVPVGEGAMAALLGLDLQAASAAAEEAGTKEQPCTTANDNSPGQVVISGTKAAVERACEIAREKGAKRCVMLPVSAPFHCPLMAPAAEIMQSALDVVQMAPPVVPVVTNVSASQTTNTDEIRQMLVKQVTAMVRWRESVLYMKDNGVNTVVEIGAGKVLAGLVRRIDGELSSINVGTPDEIEIFLKTL